MVTVTIKLMNFLKYGHCHQDGKIIFMVTVPFIFFGDRDHIYLIEGTVTIYSCVFVFTFSSGLGTVTFKFLVTVPIKMMI